jgi:hypothetical protein
MFITPVVLETQLDLRAVMDDLRRKMDWLDEVFPTLKQPAASVPPQ